MSNRHGNMILLLDDYSGPVSELTAINQYLHHHFVVDKPDVAELLERVAIEEMHHMEKLAYALVEAGIDPRFYNSKKEYWHGTYVNYQYTVCNILQSDIQAELEAIFQYYRHMQLIHDPAIQKLLENIIQDELLHIQMFMAKMGKYCPSFPVYRWLGDQVTSFETDTQFKEQIVNILSQKDDI